MDPLQLQEALRAAGVATGAAAGAAFGGAASLPGSALGAAVGSPLQASAPVPTPGAPPVGDAVPSPIAPAVMPSVPEASSGPLQAAFRADLDDRFGPSQVYLMNSLATNGGAKDSRNMVFGLGQQGVTFDDYMNQRHVDSAHVAAQNIAARTGDMADPDFDRLYSSLKDHLTPPAPTADPTLRAPGLAELAVSGLAALLAPRFAPIALAAPFKSRLQQHSIDVQRNQQKNADDYRRWQAQVEGTKDALGILERRDAAREGVAARRDNSRNVLLGRLTTADTPTELRASFAALDAGGYGDSLPKEQRDALLAESQKRTDDAGKAKKLAGDETLVQKYLTAADDPNILPAMRAQHARNARALIAANDPNDPRLSQIDAILPKLAQPSQKQADDHAKAVVGVADTQAGIALKGAQTANTQARTQTENLTRQGKVNLLLQQGKLAEANTEARNANNELDAIRKRYLPQQLQANINKADAEADRARRTATDTLGSMTNRAQSSADAWTRLGVKLQDAEGKTRAALQGIQPQKDAITARMGQIDQALAAGTQNGSLNDAQKASLAKEKGELGLALGKLGAVYAEKTAYLDAVKQQQSTVSAKAQEATARATTGPAQGGNAPVLGFSPYDAHERAYLADLQARIASGKYDAGALRQIAARDIAQYRKQKGYK